MISNALSSKTQDYNQGGTSWRSSDFCALYDVTVQEDVRLNSAFLLLSDTHDRVEQICPLQKLNSWFCQQKAGL